MMVRRRIRPSGRRATGPDRAAAMDRQTEDPKEGRGRNGPPEQCGRNGPEQGHGHQGHEQGETT